MISPTTMAINGRHISNAIIEWRRIRRRKPRFLIGALAVSDSPPGNHVWTISAMTLNP
jgi:hypothetical protein